MILKANCDDYIQVQVLCYINFNKQPKASHKVSLAYGKKHNNEALRFKTDVKSILSCHIDSLLIYGKSGKQMSLDRQCI